MGIVFTESSLKAVLCSKFHKLPCKIKVLCFQQLVLNIFAGRKTPPYMYFYIHYIPAVLLWLPSNLLFVAATLLRLPHLPLSDFLHGPECNLLRVWTWWISAVVIHYVTAGGEAETIKRNETHSLFSNHSMSRRCSRLVRWSCCGESRVCHTQKAQCDCWTLILTLHVCCSSLYYPQFVLFTPGRRQI